MIEDKLSKHIEFETKIRIENDSIVSFKLLIESLPGLKSFLYVEGPDTYFVNESGDFLRYRKPSFNVGNTELTMKKKIESKNNIIRKEWNLKINDTPEQTVLEMIQNLGFVFNFKIWKSCNIYFFEDVTVVVYTVADITYGDTKDLNSFLEIEVKEENIHDLTEEDAWSIISKYEKLLSSMGITSQKRMRKSLFEIYKK